MDTRSLYCPECKIRFEISAVREEKEDNNPDEPGFSSPEEWLNHLETCPVCDAELELE